MVRNNEQIVRHLKERYTYDAEQGVVRNRNGQVIKGYDDKDGYLLLNMWLALYHLLMSAALRDLMDDGEKELFRLLTKKLQYFFCTRLSLKERKETKKKTKKKQKRKI